MKSSTYLVNKWLPVPVGKVRKEEDETVFPSLLFPGKTNSLLCMEEWGIKSIWSYYPHFIDKPIAVPDCNLPKSQSWEAEENPGSVTMSHKLFNSYKGIKGSLERIQIWEEKKIKNIHHHPQPLRILRVAFCPYVRWPVRENLEPGYYWEISGGSWRTERWGPGPGE